MNRLARWARTLAAAGAIASAALLAAAFGPTLLGMRAMIVSSGSMEPVLPLGAVALTRPVDARSVAVGDMITFRHRGDERPTTHRVIEIDQEGSAFIFTTKGDANLTPDVEPVVVTEQIDRVERVVPFAGRIVGFARSPAGGVALLVVPIVGLTVDGARKRRRRPAVLASPDPCPHCGLEPARTGTEG